jgi:hypothetical protein
MSPLLRITMELSSIFMPTIRSGRAGAQEKVRAKVIDNTINPEMRDFVRKNVGVRIARAFGRSRDALELSGFGLCLKLESAPG